MMSFAATVAARGWRRNRSAAARVGGVVRQRLWMGVSPSAPDTANNLFCCNGRGKNFSTADETSSSAFAVVDHSKAYENSMRGRHGQQLSLARLEGIGKDDLPFDPFEEEEQRYLQEHEAKLVDAEEETDGESDEEESDDSDDDDDYDSEDSDSDSDSDEEVASIYNSDGSVRRNKSVLATLKAGHPAGGLFAVVEIAGSQHKVTTDDLLVVNKLKPVDDFKIGSVHTLKDVLLVGSSHLTLVGMPHVTGAEVDVMVEEITQDAKVIVFKKRRRKHSQRKNGYRRDLTLLRVLDVRLPEDYKEHDHVGRESVDDLETVSLDNGSNYDDDASHFDIGNQISDEKGQRISPAP